MTNWRPATDADDMGGSGVGICVDVDTGGAIVVTAVPVFSITGDCPAEGVSRGVEVGTAVASIPVVDGCGPTPQAVSKTTANTATTLYKFLVTTLSDSPARTARLPRELM